MKQALTVVERRAIRPVRAALLMMLAALLSLSLAACGGSDATTATAIVGGAETAVTAAGTEVTSAVSGGAAVLEQYRGLLAGQDWTGAVALFSTSIDAAARDKVVADLTDFVASGGIPTQVVVQDVVETDTEVTATLKMYNIAATLTQKLTLSKDGETWKITKVE